MPPKRLIREPAVPPRASGDTTTGSFSRAQTSGAPATDRGSSSTSTDAPMLVSQDPRYQTLFAPPPFTTVNPQSLVMSAHPTWAPPPPDVPSPSDSSDSVSPPPSGTSAFQVDTNPSLADTSNVPPPAPFMDVIDLASFSGDPGPTSSQPSVQPSQPLTSTPVQPSQPLTSMPTHHASGVGAGLALGLSSATPGSSAMHPSLALPGPGRPSLGLPSSASASAPASASSASSSAMPGSAYRQPMPEAVGPLHPESSHDSLQEPELIPSAERLLADAPKPLPSSELCDMIDGRLVSHENQYHFIRRIKDGIGEDLEDLKKGVRYAEYHKMYQYDNYAGRVLAFKRRAADAGHAAEKTARTTPIFKDAPSFGHNLPDDWETINRPWRYRKIILDQIVDASDLMQDIRCKIRDATKH